jgi:hypothetical protein
LKDKRYNTIGYIETKSDGTQVGKNARYEIKGYYAPKRDETKDARHKVKKNGKNPSQIKQFGIGGI